jgi:acyl-CoA thioester hydrolase
MAHTFPIRVYYEDTDLAGIVYYANYLKFIERARSEFLRDLGVDQVALKSDAGVVFAVRRLEADYHQPAQFDDQLQVMTAVEELSGARALLRQDVLRDAVGLFSALVSIVALKSDGRPARIPADVRRLLEGQRA